MDQLARRYRQSEGLAARTVGGEAVVVTPADSKVHELNEVATFVFEACAEPREGRELLAALLEAFEVAPEEARQELARLLDTLVDRGVLTVV